jgi:putative transposase
MVAQGIFKKQKCHLIEMNNVADHVHVLFDLHRSEALANLVMHVKKGTSRWLKEQSPEFQRFDWQDGYRAFSVGRSPRDEVSRTLSACELIVNDPGSPVRRELRSLALG